jgi:hypothetical protein
MRQMKRIERPDRLHRERPSSTIDYLGVDAKDDPVGRRPAQDCATIRCFAFRELAAEDRTMECAITFDERQIRRRDDSGCRKRGADRFSGRLP